MPTIDVVEQREGPDALLCRIMHDGEVVGLVHSTERGIRITGPCITDDPQNVVTIDTTDFSLISSIKINLVR